MSEAKEGRDRKDGKNKESASDPQGFHRLHGNHLTDKENKTMKNTNGNMSFEQLKASIRTIDKKASGPWTDADGVVNPPISAGQAKHRFMFVFAKHFGEGPTLQEYWTLYNKKVSGLYDRNEIAQTVAIARNKQIDEAQALAGKYAELAPSKLYAQNTVNK